MKRACVIGNPIEHSRSPIMHNKWLQQLDIKGEYTRELAPLDGFEDKVRALMAEGFLGANVTIPFKERAFAMADVASPVSARMGAANTLVFKQGKIFADNTDGFGFGQNILDVVPSWKVDGRHLILGAGGAARAIAIWLIDAGASEVLIANRTRARAEALCALDHKIKAIDWAQIEDCLDVTTLINTTSRGMKGQDDIALDFSNASQELIVNDIVYTPLETGLLRDAKAAGLKAVDGLGMLLWQARPGFEAWFGQEPPAIDEALRQEMLK